MFRVGPEAGETWLEIFSEFMGKDRWIYGFKAENFLVDCLSCNLRHNDANLPWTP